LQALKKTYYTNLLDTLFKENDELVNVTLQLFSKLNVPANVEEVNDYILSHSAYPSLLTISDCLKQWNINNVAIKPEQDRLTDYPIPFIVHSDGVFKLVVKIEEEEITYLDKKAKEIKVGKKQFLNKWNGIALIAETPADATEDEAGQKVPTAKKGSSGITLFLLGGFSLIITASILYSLSASFASVIVYSLLLAFNFAGILLSGLLLWYQLDKNNPVMQKLCGKAEGSADCGAVLDSKGSKLFGVISWSEIGAFYFTGSFLTLLVIPSQITLMAWMSVLTLPYTLFSIGYQRFVAKKWCTLCLSVQALLVASFITVLAAGLLSYPVVLTPGSLLSVAVIFALPAIVWYAVSPVVSGFLKNRNSRFELARLKHDPVLFKKIISDQRRFEMPSQDIGILLGNRNARHTITKICNPYCKPCAKAHEELKEVLKNNNVRLQIVFAATTDPGDRRGLPVKHFLAIASKGNEHLTEEALDHWYLGEEKEYEDFANKFRMNGELKQQDEKVNQMDEWCRSTGIAYTPAIFVNGYLLPEPYRIPDLKYILRELE
jgi:uncharacterized membrane protein